MLTKDEHIKIHKTLHNSLDQLVADFISHTGKSLEETSIMELIKWSHQQTIEPVSKEGHYEV